MKFSMVIPELNQLNWPAGWYDVEDWTMTISHLMRHDCCLVFYGASCT